MYIYIYRQCNVCCTVRLEYGITSRSWFIYIFDELESNLTLGKSVDYGLGYCHDLAAGLLEGFG